MVFCVSLSGPGKVPLCNNLRNYKLLEGCQKQNVLGALAWEEPLASLKPNTNTNSPRTKPTEPTLLNCSKLPKRTRRIQPGGRFRWWVCSRWGRDSSQEESQCAHANTQNQERTHWAVATAHYLLQARDRGNMPKRKPADEPRFFTPEQAFGQNGAHHTKINKI